MSLRTSFSLVWMMVARIVQEQKFQPETIRVRGIIIAINKSEESIHYILMWDITHCSIPGCAKLGKKKASSLLQLS